MIEYQNFYVIHMPRAGGSFFARSLLGGYIHKPKHDGWITFSPFNKDVYGLIRKPMDWYLSLNSYSIQQNLIWKDVFGISRSEPTRNKIEKWISGTGATDKLIHMPEFMSAKNPINQMRKLDIGFWSWWVLHLYGKSGVSSKQEFDNQLRFLWLEHRDNDIERLCKKYKCVYKPRNQFRNTSKHATAQDVFDTKLIKLLNDKDGLMLDRVTRHAFGVECGI